MYFAEAADGDDGSGDEQPELISSSHRVDDNSEATESREERRAHLWIDAKVDIH